MATAAIVFIVLVLARVLAELALDWTNLRHMAANSGRIPDAYEGIMDEPTFRKAVAYATAKQRFSMATTVWGTLVILLLLPTGILGAAWQSAATFIGAGADGIWSSATIFFMVFTLSSLPGLPWDYWYHFHLEERFGFNRMTRRLWITDQVKGCFVAYVLCLALLAPTLWLVSFPLWWLWAWAFAFGFTLFMAFVGSAWVMRLFNKFKPLEDAALRERLLGFARELRFPCANILVMDGSKRSGHSNAWFMGFGSSRRIVIFDTLLDQLGEEEIKAVLAHEIGHYRCAHIPKRLAMMGCTLLGIFLAVDLALHLDGFAAAFGFPANAAVALLLTFMFASPILFWTTPIGSWFSRRAEYEADAFAREAMGSPDALASALRRMSGKNLSNPLVHPLYSTVHYSHPTLPERLAALEGRR